jgi:hypothetical protein
VEFVAEDGSTIAELALEPDAIRRLSSNRSKQRRAFSRFSATSKSGTIVRVRKDSGSFVARDKESGRLAEARRAKRKSANCVLIRLRIDCRLLGQVHGGVAAMSAFTAFL